MQESQNPVGIANNKPLYHLRAATAALWQLAFFFNIKNTFKYKKVVANSFVLIILVLIFIPVFISAHFLKVRLH